VLTFDDRSAAGRDHPLTDQGSQPKRALELILDHRVEHFSATNRSACRTEVHAALLINQRVDLAEPFVGGLDEPVELSHRRRQPGTHRRATGLAFICSATATQFSIFRWRSPLGAASRDRRTRLPGPPAAARVIRSSAVSRKAVGGSSFELAFMLGRDRAISPPCDQLGDHCPNAPWLSVRPWPCALTSLQRRSFPARCRALQLANTSSSRCSRGTAR